MVAWWHVSKEIPSSSKKWVTEPKSRLVLPDREHRRRSPGLFDVFSTCWSSHSRSWDKGKTKSLPKSKQSRDHVPFSIQTKYNYTSPGWSCRQATLFCRTSSQKLENHLNTYFRYYYTGQGVSKSQPNALVLGTLPVEFFLCNVAFLRSQGI